MRNITHALFTLLLIACTSTPRNSNLPPTANYFPNMKSCFLLYNMKTATLDEEVGDICKERFTASSSFKVPLAVMAFDSGALKDEKEILKWDGKKDSRKELNKNHNAKSWMKDSVVWFSQRLTPKIGEDKLKKYLADFDYGNEDLSGGITEAWLISPSEKSALKISAYEQLEFMKRLWKDDLPVSKRAMQLTRDITFLENSPSGFKLHGKTGSNFFDKDKKVRLGWFIAHLQKDDQEYVLVTVLQDLGPTEEKGYGGLKARETTKKMLADLKLW